MPKKAITLQYFCDEQYCFGRCNSEHLKYKASVY